MQAVFPMQISVKLDSETLNCTLSNTFSCAILQHYPLKQIHQSCGHIAGLAFHS